MIEAPPQTPEQSEIDEAPGPFLAPRYRCWNLRLSQHKSVEFQISRWPDAKMFDAEFRWRPRRDHAGVELSITAFWCEFRTAFYDHRHWDVERGAFKTAG
jgi:hypothetical protein